MSRLRLLRNQRVFGLTIIYLFVSILLLLEPTVLRSVTEKHSKTPSQNPSSKFDDPFARSTDDSQPKVNLSDPLKRANRYSFSFNKFYLFGVIKPLNSGWETITTPSARQHIRNFFLNLEEPVTIVNSLLQGEWVDAHDSSIRLIVNSTFGLGGFVDVAGRYHPRVKRTFDQTFARWGIPPGFYIHWPFFGPSTPRDTVGIIGGAVLNPLNYAEEGTVVLASQSFYSVNEYSFRGKELENIMKYSINGYTSLKNIYEQRLFRQKAPDS